MTKDDRELMDLPTRTRNMQSQELLQEKDGYIKGVVLFP